MPSVSFQELASAEALHKLATVHWPSSIIMLGKAFIRALIQVLSSQHFRYVLLLNEQLALVKQAAASEVEVQDVAADNMAITPHIAWSIGSQAVDLKLFVGMPLPAETKELAAGIGQHIEEEVIHICAITTTDCVMALQSAWLHWPYPFVKATWRSSTQAARTLQSLCLYAYF